MSNLTITVDEEVLRRARIRALEQGTSVNKVLGEYLKTYAGIAHIEDAVEGALAVATRASGGSGPAGRSWTREDLHDH